MMTIRTTVPVTAEQPRRLKEIADEHGLSLAWIVCRAVREFLERNEKRGDFNPLAAPEKDQG